MDGVDSPIGVSIRRRRNWRDPMVSAAGRQRPEQFAAPASGCEAGGVSSTCRPFYQQLADIASDVGFDSHFAVHHCSSSFRAGNFRPVLEQPRRRSRRDALVAGGRPHSPDFSYGVAIQFPASCQCRAGRHHRMGICAAWIHQCAAFWIVDGGCRRWIARVATLLDATAMGWLAPGGLCVGRCSDDLVGNSRRHIRHGGRDGRAHSARQARSWLARDWNRCRSHGHRVHRSVDLRATGTTRISALDRRRRR